MVLIFVSLTFVIGEAKELDIEDTSGIEDRDASFLMVRKRPRLMKSLVGLPPIMQSGRVF